MRDSPSYPSAVDLIAVSTKLSQAVVAWPLRPIAIVPILLPTTKALLPWLSSVGVARLCRHDAISKIFNRGRCLCREEEKVSGQLRLSFSQASGTDREYGLAEPTEGTPPRQSSSGELHQRAKNFTIVRMRGGATRRFLPLQFTMHVSGVSAGPSCGFAFTCAKSSACTSFS